MSDCKLKDGFDKVYRLGEENERMRIRIKIIKKQTEYIKHGLIGGSCGLDWLIRELKEDIDKRRGEMTLNKDILVLILRRDLTILKKMNDPLKMIPRIKKDIKLIENGDIRTLKKYSDFVKNRQIIGLQKLKRLR